MFTGQRRRTQRGGSHRRSSGFTLLEVCFVLCVVALLAAVAVPSTTRIYQEEVLRAPIRELQSFAKNARTRAMTDNYAYDVLLTNTGFVLQRSDRSEELRRYELASTVSYSVKRFGEKDFEPHADGRWVFAPNGLCEPVEFLFERGKDWVRFQIDPLTARAINEQSVIN